MHRKSLLPLLIGSLRQSYAFCLLDLYHAFLSLTEDMIAEAGFA